MEALDATVSRLCLDRSEDRAKIRTSSQDLPSKWTLEEVALFHDASLFSNMSGYFLSSAGLPSRATIARDFQRVFDRFGRALSPLWHGVLDRVPSDREFPS